jgi:AcrR family transcriptional regulator
MPTGVALRDPRDQLFAAAEDVLLREGPQGLTSRAVTTEAGVAKGVLHRHFDDFDDFLAQLVERQVDSTRTTGAALLLSAGSDTVVRIVSDALTAFLRPLPLALVTLVIARDGVRRRLRQRTGAARGLPVLTEAGAALAAYLGAERDRGRLRPDADPDTLAFTLVGAGHLLFAGEAGGLPDDEVLTQVVSQVLSQVLAGARPAPSPRS